MNELLEKVDVEDSFYIYLQRNSKVWLARFKINGKWISRTTKQRVKSKAITAAIKVKAECDFMLAHGIAIQTKAFRDVAEMAIKRMDEALPGTKGIGSFENYKLFLNRYHVPFFDRMHITSIDRAKLMEFDTWRIESAGRQLTQSTIKSHNAALQKVFDEAVTRICDNHSCTGVQRGLAFADGDQYMRHFVLGMYLHVAPPQVVHFSAGAHACVHRNLKIVVQQFTN